MCAARASGLFSDPNLLEKNIKDTFYNSLANYVLSQDRVTQETLPTYMLAAIQITIKDIVQASKSCAGIRLPMGDIITMYNCPPKYKNLFKMLLELKSASSYDDIKIQYLATQVMRLDSFQDFNPAQFILEALGISSPDLQHIQEEGVTADLIRDTFYNEMVMQTLLAVDNGWISLTDIEEQTPEIYFALPALTILEAIHQSQQSDGIRLLNGKVVNARNCPSVEKFPELVKLILDAKVQIPAMSDLQLLVIKHIIASNSELSAELSAIRTPELTQLVTIIKNNMAMEISKRQYFHRMIGTVLTMVAETLKPDAISAPSSAPASS